MLQRHTSTSSSMRFGSQPMCVASDSGCRTWFLPILLILFSGLLLHPHIALANSHHRLQRRSLPDSSPIYHEHHHHHHQHHDEKSGGDGGVSSSSSSNSDDGGSVDEPPFFTLPECLPNESCLYKAFGHDFEMCSCPTPSPDVATDVRIEGNEGGESEESAVATDSGSSCAEGGKNALNHKGVVYNFCDSSTVIGACKLGQLSMTVKGLRSFIYCHCGGPPSDDADAGDDGGEDGTGEADNNSSSRRFRTPAYELRKKRVNDEEIHFYCALSKRAEKRRQSKAP